MKIVADDQIVLLDELLEGLEVVKKPGVSICRADLKDADALWVRTVTPVNAELLENTSVRFVGTATAGYDHLDTKWLDGQGILWKYAAGANAMAVAEYVLCSIAALRSQGLLTASSLRAGVIGVGQAGCLVAAELEKIGFEVLRNDPPRAQREEHFYSTPLDQFENLDLICVHAALTFGGEFPSYHLLNDDFFQRQKPGCVLLNAARGALIDTQVLLRQSHLHLCLDVWENEPEIDVELLRRACIATPHIAGYSIEAKRRASLLLYNQMMVSLPSLQAPSSLRARAKQSSSEPKSKCELDCFARARNDDGARNDKTLKIKAIQQDRMEFSNWEKRALQVEDLFARTQQMRETLLKNPTQIGDSFLQLRRDYPLRESL